MPVDVRVNNAATADSSGASPDGTAAFPLNITGGAATTAKATAAVPAYIEGSSNPLSQTLWGALRVGGPVPTGTAGAWNPLPMGARARSTLPVTLANNVIGDIVATLAGVICTFLYSPPDLSWQAVAPASGIVSSTTAVVLNAAGAAGVRNYLTRLQIACDTLSAVTEIVILDGVSIIWRSKLQTAAMPSDAIMFDPPLRGTAATSMSVQLLTSVTGGVYVNAQGFLAP